MSAKGISSIRKIKKVIVSDRERFPVHFRRLIYHATHNKALLIDIFISIKVGKLLFLESHTFGLEYTFGVGSF